MSMLHGGLLGVILGETPSTKYDIESYQRQGLAETLYGFQNMANQRLGHGLEPIDWPQIIVNQYKAIALTRPLSVLEQFTYDGALQALNSK